MAEQMIFKRYEIKYMLNKSQFEALKVEMTKYMTPDVHGKSTNCSLYFDTPDFLLARRSMEHPLYKEKLRVRSYGIAHGDTTVFVELKKKYESVTYKRRIALGKEDMEKYLIDHKKVMDTQISREIDYCMDYYKGLAPAIFLAYDRQACYGKNDHDFRMTFDENIRWRDDDLSLDKGFYGSQILGEDMVLLEIKVANAMPMWLVRFLNSNHIYKTSYSKYVTAYKALMEEKKITDDNLLCGGIKQYA